jgi:hypothetical protein
MATYKTEVITPRDAKRLLGKNAENNRLPKESRIPQYARDMKSGRWVEGTGETIKIDVNGNVVDGQNRLQAVILADVPITFDIAYDVPAGAMAVIDTGASRTAADAMRISGAPERMMSAAVVRWVIQWDAGSFIGHSGSIRPTVSEILDRYLSDMDAFDAAAKRAQDCRRNGLGTGSVAGVAHYLFWRIDQEQTHQFYDQFISGANLPERASVLALRNRIARLRIDRATRSEQLALFVRAWNAFREGRPMERMMITRKGDLTNANFPQPK